MLFILTILTWKLVFLANVTANSFTSTYFISFQRAQNINSVDLIVTTLNFYYDDFIIRFTKEFVYRKYNIFIKSPSTLEEFRNAEQEYAQAGFPG